MFDNEEMQASGAKHEWVRPELKRIEAGSAESRESGAPDGGLADQGS